MIEDLDGLGLELVEVKRVGEEAKCERAHE